MGTLDQSARLANAALNAREYHERRVMLRSRPTMVFVELTQNCNLTCRMCRSAGGYDASRNMTDGLFELVIQELGETASWIDLRGWGESTLLADFSAKLRRAAESGARLRLVTNALLIEASHFEVICQSAGVVAVSVDAATPDLFAQLGRGDLKRVMKNVRVGVDVSRTCGMGEIYLNTVVSQFNMHELPDIVSMAASAGVTRVVMSPIKTFPGHCAGLESASDEIREYVAAAAARAIEVGVVLQLGASLHDDHVVAEALPSTCASPWSHALINYNGEVVFCDHLLNRPDYSMGSMLHLSFGDIWNGEVFQNLRQAHVDAERSRVVGSAFQKCNWCYARRYMDGDPAPIPLERLREVSTRAEGARRLH
jgi:radical SAM protein with 4Fe4S-binding SPASM domain